MRGCAQSLSLLHIVSFLNFSPHEHVLFIRLFLVMFSGQNNPMTQGPFLIPNESVVLC